MAPVKVWYLLLPATAQKENIQIGVGVSKRNFKKAVHRNRVKRLLREAYRLQKLPLQKKMEEEKERRLFLFLLYTGKELPDYWMLKEKVALILNRLEEGINKA